MARTASTPKPKSRTRIDSKRKIAGLGFLPSEARHGFLIEVPKGKSNNDFIRITEYRNVDISLLELSDESGLGSQSDFPSPDQNLTISDDALAGSPRHERDKQLGLRVLIDRGRWLSLAPGFYEEANRRLRANGLPSFKFQKSPSKPIPVHPSLGKELCVLCWSVEEAQTDLIPNALMNWEALAPEERWWLYTMTVATTGQALQHGLGWRKALRAALAENPFVKGEGSSSRSRRELLGHAQMTLNFD